MAESGQKEVVFNGPHWLKGTAVAKPDRTGFGSRLIKRGLGTPGSRTEIDYAPAGLHCRLEGILCP